MTFPRWPPWAGWALAGLLIFGAAFAYASDQVRIGEARQADRISAERDSIREAARERARRDSARLDSVRRSERLLRDSLHVLLNRADTDATEAAGEVQVQTVALDSTLAELARRVPDRLVGLVTRAMEQADSLRGAHARFADAMERQVALLARDTVSLRRELDQTAQTLASTRSALHEAESALDAMTDARDRWRAAADPGLLAELLGPGLLSAAGTIGGGVAAFAVDERAGAGYVAAVVVRGLVAQ